MDETQLKQFLGESVFNDIKGQIQKIEGSLETTKNHYGDYMHIFGMTQDKQKRLVMANIFLILGANPLGVKDALTILG